MYGQFRAAGLYITGNLGLHASFSMSEDLFDRYVLNKKQHWMLVVRGGI